MHVVVVCYKIEKNRGSEDGSGYNFTRLLARHDDVQLTIVTRQKNASALRDDDDFAYVTIIGYDLPKIMTWWKRRNRGLLLYYYLWQAAVAKVVRKIQTQQEVDVVHQYNFHTDSTPHFHRKGSSAIIWGPICHQPYVPRDYCRLEPVAGPVRELLRSAFKQFFWRCDPFMRRAISNTTLVLYANNDIASPFRLIENLRLQPFGGANFVSATSVPNKTDEGRLNLLHVGRTVSIKGCSVAVEAIAGLAPEVSVRLVLVGDGKLLPRLRQLIRQKQLEDRILLVPWIGQDELVGYYCSADAFLYPSLGNQDSVVAEALAAGLPVIGVQGTGTALMAGEAGMMASRASYSRTLLDLQAHVRTLSDEKNFDQRSLADRKKAATLRSREISWQATVDSIKACYL